MSAFKTKSLENVERRMEGMDENSLRYRVLQSVKNFKTSWIDLGQSLYSVWKDKLYRDWGYLTFEAYTSKEIGIRKDTAMKLLKSYYFIEKEEPQYLQKDFNEPTEAALLPSYETVNALRLAKNKRGLEEGDYASLKRDIFEKGKDVREVRKELTALIKQREELTPQEARQKRKVGVVRRLLSTLRSLKEELETAKFLPTDNLREIESLIDKLEAVVSSHR